MIDSYRTSPGDLRVYRLIFAAYLIVAVIPVAPWFSQMPVAFFAPPIGLAALWTRPFQPAVMHGLNIVLAVCAVLLLAGRYVRVASIGTGLTLLVLNSGQYSFGKINHDVLLVMTPLVLAWSWGDRDGPTAMPLAVLAFLTGFAMSWAGLEKAMTGWLNPTLRCTYGHTVYGVLVNGRDTLLARFLIPVDSPFFWKSMDYATVAFEGALFPAALRRRWFITVLAIAVVFHVGVSLLLDIDFSWNVVCYAAFVRWSAIPVIRDLKITPLTGATAALAAAVALIVDYAPMALSRLPVHTAIVWTGAGVGLYHLSRSLRVSSRA